jgi:hypothetical protein
MSPSTPLKIMECGINCSLFHMVVKQKTNALKILMLDTPVIVSKVTFDVFHLVIMKIHHGFLYGSNLPHIHAHGPQWYHSHWIGVKLATLTHVRQSASETNTKCFFIQKRAH